MSSQSSQGAHWKKGFSTKMSVVAVLIGVVFLTIIIVHPRIFNPSNIGLSTAPAPLVNTQRSH